MSQSVKQKKPRLALRALYRADLKTGLIPQDTPAAAIKSLVGHGLIQAAAPGRYQLTDIGLLRYRHMHDAVARYNNEQETIKHIAKVLGTTMGAVSGWLDAADVVRRVPGSFNNDDDEQIVRMYVEQYMGLEAIGDVLGVSRMTVSRALDRKKIKRRPRFGR